MYYITLGFCEKLFNIVIKQDDNVLHDFCRINDGENSLIIKDIFSDIFISLKYYDDSKSVRIVNYNMNNMKVKLKTAIYDKDNGRIKFVYENGRRLSINTIKHNITFNGKMTTGFNTNDYNPAVGFLIKTIVTEFPNCLMIRSSGNSIDFEINDDIEFNKIYNIIMNTICDIAIFL